MPKMIIMRENLPTRCDICHQMDLFDPQTGECKRCKKLANQLKKLSKKQISHPSDASALQVFGALLLFGVNIYFLPYARLSIQNFWLIWGIYFSSVTIGIILIFCGKSRPMI